MSKWLRFSVAGCLAAVLAPSSVLLATPPDAHATALGVITQAQRANVDNNSATTGSTIFDGDLLSTERDGSLRVRVGSSQAYLFASGEAVLHQSADGFSANLSRGGLVLSSEPGQTFYLLADGATIQPSSSRPTVAQVTWVSPTELVVISRKGALQIQMGGETQTIADGASYEMVIDPAAASAASMPGAPQAKAPGQNKFRLLLLGTAILAIAVGTILAIESPWSP